MGRSTRTALAGLALAVVALSACGDDEAEPRAEESTSTTLGTVVIDGVDYAFENVPESVPAGTTLGLRNTSEAELHELVAFQLPDDERRSLDVLLALPPDQLFPALGEPTTVLLQAPGSDEVIPAVGTGTLTEPGRYLLMCAIPTGADPAEYLAAAAESEGGPPQVAGGPPHFMEGMAALLLVE
ncbi:MAG: hypothetical protein ACSLFP_15575 [Acidimicrobiales bacterium]